MPDYCAFTPQSTDDFANYNGYAFLIVYNGCPLYNVFSAMQDTFVSHAMLGVGTTDQLTYNIDFLAFAFYDLQEVSQLNFYCYQFMCPNASFCIPVRSLCNT